jgi:hypothetical protein
MKQKLGKRFKLSFAKLANLTRRDKPFRNVFKPQPPTPQMINTAEPNQGIVSEEGSYTLSPLVFNTSTASGSYYIPSVSSSATTTGTGSLISEYGTSNIIPSAAQAAANAPPPLPDRKNPLGLVINTDIHSPDSEWYKQFPPVPPNSPSYSPLFPKVPTGSPGVGGKVPSPFSHSPSDLMWAALKLPGTTGASPVSADSPIVTATTDSNESISPWVINGNPIVQNTLVKNDNTQNATPSNTWQTSTNVDEDTIMSTISPDQDVVTKNDTSFEPDVYTNPNPETVAQDYSRPEAQTEVQAELLDLVKGQNATNSAVRGNSAGKRYLSPVTSVGKLYFNTRDYTRG